MTTTCLEDTIIELVKTGARPKPALLDRCNLSLFPLSTVGTTFDKVKAEHVVLRSRGLIPCVGPFKDKSSALACHERLQNKITSQPTGTLIRHLWEVRKFLVKVPAPPVEPSVWKAYDALFQESLPFQSVLCQQTIPGGCVIPETKYQTPGYRTQRDANYGYRAAFQRMLPLAFKSLQDSFVLADEDEQVRVMDYLRGAYRREFFLRRFVSDVPGLRSKVLKGNRFLTEFWAEEGQNFDENPDIVSTDQPTRLQ